MKSHAKGFAFVPLLIVFFLLVVSAVTSYVVINQGTGGFASRAAGSCTSESCIYERLPNSYAFGCRSTKYCYSTSTNCLAIDKYRQSGNSVATHSCTSGATCSNSAQCATGLSCNYGKCIAANGPCNVGYDQQCGPGKCAGGGTASCLSPNVCTNGYCKSATYTPPIANPKPEASPTPTSNPCLVGSGSRCGQSAVATLHCPDGVIGCASPNTCQSGTCRSKDTQVASCYAGGGQPCGQSNPVCTSNSGKVGCQTGYSCFSGRCQTEDPKPPAGTQSCAGGFLCDGTQVTGAAGETVCGSKDASGTCRTSQCNGSTGQWTYVGNLCGITPPPSGGGGGGGGGGVTPTDPKPPTGSQTCSGGVLCNGTLVTGTAGQVVCGQKDAGGTCRTSQCNGSTGQWNYVGNACSVTLTPTVTPTVTTTTTPTTTPTTELCRDKSGYGRICK